MEFVVRVRDFWGKSEGDDVNSDLVSGCLIRCDTIAACYVQLPRLHKSANSALSEAATSTPR